jgi:hypothetical protein
MVPFMRPLYSSVAKECKNVKQHKQITINPFANKSENLLLIYIDEKIKMNPAFLMNPAFFEVRNYFFSIQFIYEKGNTGYGMRKINVNKRWRD